MFEGFFFFAGEILFNVVCDYHSPLQLVVCLSACVGGVKNKDSF